MVDKDDDVSADSDDSTSSDDYTYVYAVSKDNSQNKLFANMCIDDRLVKFQIDSGATCNLVPDSILSLDLFNGIDTSKSTVLHMYNGATECTLDELAVKLKKPKNWR